MQSSSMRHAGNQYFVAKIIAVNARGMLGSAALFKSLRILYTSLKYLL